ncbi:lysozyme inhibitor LprI family protein [Burkholderia semiarida]|uniref:lysozyme inhibitor LprI family protein n=1 Tax=Burkholderia semiarida TaxID=2843303 RepID=UPI00387829B8
MAVQAPSKTGFEKWQDGIDKAVGDTRWDSWDCEIRMAVDEYNLAQWDEDAKYINLAKIRLAASQKAFVKYRTAQYAFASSLGGGAIGNALEMQRLACVAELNNRRAAQLRDAVSDLPLK